MLGVCKRTRQRSVLAFKEPAGRSLTGAGNCAYLLEGYESLVLRIHVVLVDLVCQEDQPFFGTELDDIYLVLFGQDGTYKYKFQTPTRPCSSQTSDLR